MANPNTWPFNPRLFLKLARYLGESEDEERLRTAVGRAYYAVFLVAYQKLGITAIKDVHGAVIDCLWRRRKTALADKMFRLRNLRGVADYEMIPVNEHDRDWKNNWIRHEKLVDEVMMALDKL